MGVQGLVLFGNDIRRKLVEQAGNLKKDCLRNPKWGAALGVALLAIAIFKGPLLAIGCVGATFIGYCISELATHDPYRIGHDYLRVFRDNNNYTMMITMVGFLFACTVAPVMLPIMSAALLGSSIYLLNN